MRGNFAISGTPLIQPYLEFPYAMFGNHDFIWKFGIDPNLLFGNSKIIKFGFKSNFTIVF